MNQALSYGRKIFPLTALIAVVAVVIAIAGFLIDKWPELTTTWSSWSQARPALLFWSCWGTAFGCMIGLGLCLSVVFDLAPGKARLAVAIGAIVTLMASIIIVIVMAETFTSLPPYEKAAAYFIYAGWYIIIPWLLISSNRK